MRRRHHQPHPPPAHRSPACRRCSCPTPPTATIDWPAVEAHIARTVDAGLTPAVNMDTGYVQLLDAADRERVLDLAAAVTGGGVRGRRLRGRRARRRRSTSPRYAAAGGRHRRARRHAGDLPVPRAERARRRRLGRRRSRPSAPTSTAFIGFELGADVRAVRAHLLARRLPRAARHRRRASAPSTRRSAASSSGTGSPCATSARPDFQVFTGNDLAIDMVMYGSDYLLGLSTFAPERFADRDRLLGRRRPRASTSCNDLLQYLGQFAFRAPVPAYRHDAAMFLQLRGWARSDVTRPASPGAPSPTATCSPTSPSAWACCT